MRTYKRKTDRPNIRKDVIKQAVDEVTNGKSIRKAAKDNGIDRTTLSRYVNKLKTNSDSDVFKEYTNARQVFSTEQEKILKDYLIKVASIFYGLTPLDVRGLAYECAVRYKRNIPDSWNTNKLAGKDWLTAFLKRNRELSIRKPEPTSLGRATSFNKTNVNLFYEKLAVVMDKHKFQPSRIWNLDETGVPTVLKPAKIIAAKGKHNIGSVTSGERGTNVTVIGAVSATGNTIPVMFIFPRKKFKDYFIANGPPECIGRGNGSGWVTDDEFFDFMQHFIDHVKPTPESPVLLLLDNHSSHLAIKTVELAKENGVVMFSFPPHCTHKLQPLDISVYGPFKKYLSSAHDAWLRSNPGKTISIYEIPKLVATALPLAMTPTNIMSGFKKAGIYPFDNKIFSEEDFMPSYVTDRAESQSQTQENPKKDTNAELQSFSKTTLVSANAEDEASMLLSPTSTASANPDLLNNKGEENQESDIDTPSTSRDYVPFSPEFVRPLPKAGPRKQKTRGQKRSCAVLTDTPEKDALRLEQSNRKTKTGKKIDNLKKKTVKKVIFKNPSEFDKENNSSNKKTKKVNKYNKNKIQLLSDSEEDDYFCLVCTESYSDSLPGEEWVQCTSCQDWAHIRCTSGVSAIYVCMNCESD